MERKKAKKSKKRSKRDSSSSDSEDETMKILRKVEEERKRKEEAFRQEKAILKATELPEEKRLRRLRKKEEKERRRKERMGWDSEYLHYTNADNPFGDANLLDTFVWKKKLQREGLDSISAEELERRNREKMEENRRELEKVKQRRIEREIEKARREAEMQEQQRTKEQAQLDAFGKHEDQFHLEQARLRSKIRIQDGRAKPIDLLAKYIEAEEESDAIEMHEPYSYLIGLTIKDLEDLAEDINVYKQLEKGKNLDYWNDMTEIVDDELQKMRKLEKKQTDYEAAVGRRQGIHQAVAHEVQAIFKGKSSRQLTALQEQIEKKMASPTDGLDIGYWESLLVQLKAHLARARLRDRHQENLKRKLQLLKQQQQKQQGPEDEKETDMSSTNDVATEVVKVKEEELSDGSVDEEKEAERIINESLKAYETGRYSPVYMRPEQVDPEAIVIDPADDDRKVHYHREQIFEVGRKMLRSEQQQQQQQMTSEEKVMQAEARKGMTNDEVQFSVESALENQVYLWADKYRPRKPRYFNRVHTGFEWNKYNQTHYDMDNPPPKIVQGYKFNIFYPDVMDKNCTPEYSVTPCPDNTEFAVLKFHAGPPYEDIAFKIVNREWEYSYKRGFRCHFHNNIFQLWFHFKRYRYRR